jgi:serine/threonine-protein kinase
MQREARRDTFARVVQIRAENIGRACRDFRVRAALWMSVSLIGLAFGLFIIGLMVVVLFDDGSHSSTPPPDPIFTAFCGLFAGLFPAVVSLAGMVIGARELRRAAALEVVLVTFPNGATFDFPRLNQVLGPARAQRAYVDALSRGGIFDPHAPTPNPQSPSLPAPAFGGRPSPSYPTPSPYLPSSQPPSHRPPPMPIELPSGDGLPTHPSARANPLAATTPSLFPNTQPTPAAGGIRPDARSAVKSASDLTGRTLKDTWFVEKRLAAGGMGAVYAARHLRTGRRYAIKTMLPDERVSVEALRRFEREAKAASALGHAGIVAVHDFDKTEDGVHFLVMDLLEGETLEHRLARLGRLAWPDARAVALEVAEALGAAHEQGILHRDLKPSNVFMSARPGRAERAVLVDFGLAKPIREGGSVWVTRTGAIVGTAHYMAPEQARGERVDARADVYGLGALTYEMIAGVPPFLGNTAFAVLTLLLTEQPVPPSALVAGIPPSLDALVLRALAKDANDRPQSVAAFARELAATTG